MKTETLKVNLVLTEKMLGTVPKDKEIYKTFIATKAPVPENGIEEVESVEQIEQKGWTGFHSDSEGIFIYDYMIRGFLKSASDALKGQMELKAMRSKIDTFVFVFPRKIYFKRVGKNIKEPEGVVERPLRASTPMGPRVTLVRSDVIEVGAELDFEIRIVENDKGINKKRVIELLEYGAYQGLGQFRNGSYGRFTNGVVK